MDPQMQNQAVPADSKKWIWIGAGIVVVGLLVWWLGSGLVTQSPGTQTLPEGDPMVSQAEDSTATIEQQLNAATDFGAVEEELKTTDADVNSL